MYPTLEMIKICPKRRLFNDINDVFWMGFGFKIWRCDRSSLEPVPHNHIGSAVTPIGPKFRSCEYRLARWLLHALRGGRYIETCRAKRLLHVLQRQPCTSRKKSCTCKARSATKCLQGASGAVYGQARGATVQRLFQGGRTRLGRAEHQYPSGPWAQYMYRLAWTCQLN